MFDPAVFDKEVDDLLLSGQEAAAEERMLREYSELKATGDVGIENVISRLAHFYSMPGTENLDRAETYFLEGERLLPGAGTKYETAMFYFYVVGDAEKTIRKVDEIESLPTDRASYYSALTLKGQSLVKLEKFHDAESVLRELLELIRSNPSGLPYGDELNLMEVAILVPMLAPKCCELLGLALPTIRSQEYQERAKLLLRYPPCSPEVSG
jgi:hypothetical protein